MQAELIFDPSSEIGSCHAATIAALADDSLLCAWFAGTHEGHEDVAIWLARHDGQGWSTPAIVADVPGVPLWNPVLFRDAQDEVWLLYKAAPAIPAWTGLVMRSRDGGSSWSEPVMLPAGLLGPAKNKPITLSNGDILSPTSSETWQSWTSWVEISADSGRSWTRHGPITAPGRDSGMGGIGPTSAVWDAESQTLALPQGHRGVIQPAVWEYAPGKLRMVMRATRPVGAICMAGSDDYGRTWSAARTTDIANPNSGLDAARLPDGRVVLACNPVRAGRTPLSLFVSEDNGDTWQRYADLETALGEYSYPSVIVTGYGVVHVVYTYDRRSIKHVAMRP